MRFRQFKNYTLTESSADLESQKAIHDLDVISNSLSQLPVEKENVKNVVAQMLILKKQFTKTRLFIFIYIVIIVLLDIM